MTRKYFRKYFIRLCLGTGLAKRSVLCTRLISEGLIFQMHGWVHGKTLLLIIPGRPGNVICGPILAISVTVWTLSDKGDRQEGLGCLFGNIRVYEITCYVLWSMRGLHVLCVFRWA